MGIDYEHLIKGLPGKTVLRPNSASDGTLSGHAAGEPFANLVYADLLRRHPGKIFKQYDYLNQLYINNRRSLSYEQRKSLLPSETLAFLLGRGMRATEQWRPDNQFAEKQDDTADILYCDCGSYDLLDVKSHDPAKNAQPPNIISAYKVAQMCALLLDHEDDENSFDINYVGVDWIEEGQQLKCVAASHARLFLASPEKLYINWAAAIQLQFHVKNLPQDFPGTRREWAVRFLRHFCNSASRRCEEMLDKFVRPYRRYID